MFTTLDFFDIIDGKFTTGISFRKGPVGYMPVYHTGTYFCYRVAYRHFSIYIYIYIYTIKNIQYIV
jgi:hypothetical protein